MKLEQGDNVFRVLSSAVIGWEYWNTQNKPVRSKEAITDTPKDIRLNNDGTPTKVKHFWAFVVWDYKDKTVKLLQITQASIQKAIKGYVDDADWGDPKKYDLVITRKGEGIETEYSIRPKPHSEISKEAQSAYESEVIDLDRVYQNENPFGSEGRPVSVDLDDEVPLDDIPA